MAISQKITFEDLKEQIARRISEYRLIQGDGAAGTLDISLRSSAARTFKAHWTGYRLVYPQPTLVLLAWLKDGSFWSEGYISTDQPSYVLALRKQPHAQRGTGAERPDDKFTSTQSLEVAAQQRADWIAAGLVPDEETIRYEDFDSPMEAIDQFFNYTQFYCLDSVKAVWSDFGYSVDPSLGWNPGEAARASVPIEAAIDEGLKRSDILWLTPDTSPDQAVPCWFLYTKDKRLFVLSGEQEQIIPAAQNVRRAHVVTRRKGRDARMAEFDASVRHISGENPEEFEEVGGLLLAKRQSVTGSHEDNLKRWMREGVILELTPLD